MKTRKLYILFTIVITMWLLSGCGAKTSTKASLPSIDQSASVEVRANAAQLFAQREDLSKLRQAIASLGGLRDPDNRIYELEWTFAKYNYFLGRHSTDESEAEKAFETGKDAGSLASRMEPQKPDGHFWYAANLGELSKRSPITVGLQSVDDIRGAMDRVIEIDPGYQGASAYDALGQLELATRLNGGSAEKAVEYLEKGLELGKENANIRLHLAEAYFAVNRDRDAKTQLEYLQRMKPNPEYLPEHTRATEAASKLLESRF